MIDMHVHTLFSPDSGEPMRGMCERALALGLGGLCFTEHMDFEESVRDYYNPEAFFAELGRLREFYAGRLELLAGLEFPEPHRHPRELEQACRRPYDFILGSVHDWMDGLYPSQMAEREISLSQCFARYWDEILAMVRHGGFDCVAHLDFPKRYFYCLEYEPQQLDEIFAVMQKNGLVLEINTSSLRMGCEEPMPGAALLRQYIAHGGRQVTLGSDAHRAEDLYAGVEEAEKLARGLELEAVVYRKRISS